LDEHWASKKINVKTKWKQFRPAVKSDVRFLAMVADEIEGYAHELPHSGISTA